jgi:membrane fusion protein (multidrug efflux system)
LRISTTQETETSELPEVGTIDTTTPQPQPPAQDATGNSGRTVPLDAPGEPPRPDHAKADTHATAVEAGGVSSTTAAPATLRRPGGQRIRGLAPWAARVGEWAMAALGVAVGVVMLAEFVFYRFTRSMTNDAFVEAHIVHLSAQVEGLVTRVHVEEHDRLRAGEVTAELDPVPARRELELAAARRSVAETTLAFGQATLERLEQQFPRRVAVAEKDLAVAESELSTAGTQ